MTAFNYEKYQEHAVLRVTFGLVFPKCRWHKEAVRVKYEAVLVDTYREVEEAFHPLGSEVASKIAGYCALMECPLYSVKQRLRAAVHMMRCLSEGLVEMAVARGYDRAEAENWFAIDKAELAALITPTTKPLLEDSWEPFVAKILA
jgi:hypothetical protein